MPAAMMTPTKTMPRHMRRVSTPFAARTRRLLHQPVVGRIDAERQRRRAVGDEVDPEDLRRQQRQDDAPPPASRPIGRASSTPKNIVITSPMFDDSR